DEIRGFLALLDSRYAGPVNIGNPDEYTINQLASLVLEVTGSSSTVVHCPLPPDDPTQRRPDIGLARPVLRWQPGVDLRAGLAGADRAPAWPAPGANAGFGAAATRGAARRSAPLLLVCNPDLVVEPGAVRALAATVRRGPGLALVGARIESPAGAVYPSPRRF